jgi:hypothetical protein
MTCSKERPYGGAKALAAAILMVAGYAATRLPTLPVADRQELAGRFAFEQHPLPPAAGPQPEPRSIRRTHPSLKHIDAWISAVGAAVALADVDGDGLPNDVVHVDTRTDQVIVAPVPGSYPRYAPFALTPAPLPYDPEVMAPMGCLPGDYNEDGLTDLLVYYWGRSPVIFLRRPGSPTSGALSAADFTPCELVTPYQSWFTNALTQADLDGDGHIDLVVGNYFPDDSRILDTKATGRATMPHSLSRAFNGGRNRVFRWEGAGACPAPHVRFREVEGVFSDEVACGWTLAVGAADLDGDLLPELYFANDFGPDRLLHNRSEPGHIRFAPLVGERRLTDPRSKVLGRDSFKGMGVDFGDLNGDGWPDIYVSNIAAEYALLESHFLFLSTGRVDRMRDGIAPYHDASEQLGLARSGWAWEARLADFDNDGVLEALQATGFLKGHTDRWPELQELATSNDDLLSDPRYWPRFGPGDDLSGGDHNRFFVRGRDGRYHDIAREIGFGRPMVSRGIAVADVDGDGLLDFAVANQWGPSYLFRNTSRTRNTSLGLNLRLPPAGSAGAVIAGRPPVARSRPAIGAAATVHLRDGRRLVAQVDGGTGHSGKRSPELHFGLGDLAPGTPVRVDLRWRGVDGRVHEASLSLSPGWHTVLLGEGLMVQEGSHP